MDLREYCFFFDLDGTLLDLAPTPDAVAVEGGLQAALQKMANKQMAPLQLFPVGQLSLLIGFFPDIS